MGDKKTVLVVDDDAVNRKRAEHILEKGGYEVLTADSGKAAVEGLRTWEPDMVLLDIQMPEQDGYETFRQIRQLEGKEHLPILFLTGTVDGEEETMSETLGAAGIIKKPFLPAEFLDKLAGLS